MSLNPNTIKNQECVILSLHRLDCISYKGTGAECHSKEIPKSIVHCVVSEMGSSMFEIGHNHYCSVSQNQLECQTMKILLRWLHTNHLSGTYTVHRRLVWFARLKAYESLVCCCVSHSILKPAESERVLHTVKVHTKYVLIKAAIWETDPCFPPWTFIEGHVTTGPSCSKLNKVVSC